MYKVLLVEDEELIRQGLKLTTPWADYGCRVIGEASDGIDGAEKIRRLKPDIVITDVRMAMVDGLTMISGLQKEDLSCEYIVLSGYDDFAYAQKALQLECCGYLLKPVDDDELKQALDHAIHRLEKRKRTYPENPPAESVSQDAQFDFRNIPDKYLDKACSILKTRYNENLTLGSVAQELNISDSYLGKLFKSNTDYTFLDVLTLYRIRAAVGMLQKTDMKIYEISDAVGYTDSKYFSKIFRKITGFKPMEIKNGARISPNNILNRF